MLGVAVNVATVIAGSLVGVLLKKSLPERIAKMMQTAVALAVLYIGIDGMMSGENTLVLVLSMVIGTLIGTLLDLDRHLNNLGTKIENKFRTKNSENRIAEGFVSATLLFCVGAMTIVGALQSGLSGNHEMQFTKAILDLISSIILASTLGWGVMLAAGSVLAIQGSIVLLAQFVAPYLSNYVIGEMTCAGSVLIVALSLNLLGITKIKLMNLVPAIFVPIGLCLLIK
ncbi:MAG: DUF554 domain-containing protein [Ruminococcaceae bacterium]|nr:DUF554 domain-containing protein [Oscillospiraceae bacterium]